jgi:hypothetical protein
VRDKSELYWSLVAVGLITLSYLVYTVTSGIPAASSYFGHVLGVGGFLLMLSTETLYSLRKRATHKAWGRMQTWLKIHIFTGIVGPYMVFLHAAWSFRGIAGIVILLTGIVVLSGFIGRYIYTSVPRTADGLIIEAEALQRRIKSLEEELQSRLTFRAEHYSASKLLATTSSSISLGQTDHPAWKNFFRPRNLRKLSAKDRAVAKEMKQMLQSQLEMKRQLKRLALARRALSLWHKIHIPLGMAVFTAAMIHIIAAVYFGTLLR